MKLIVIGLGAVVILILVVVLAAMHYLKADDADDDFDDLPDDRGRARDDAADRDRHAGGRRPVREAHPPQRSASSRPRRAGNGTDPRSSRDYGEHPGRRDPRQRDPRDYAEEGGHAGDRGGRRAAARYDDGRSAQGPEQRQDGLPAVRPRQARGKRADDQGDWPSTDWDELSDVDYWAEVASDKPLTTTAQPARSARPEQTRDAETRQAQGGRPGPAPRLPVRGRREPAVPAPPAAMRQPEYSPAPVPVARAQPEFSPAPMAPRAQPGPGQWAPGVPPDSRHSEPALAMLADLGSQRMPAVPDDDPLTSPSFPRIPAADSRSYHNGRGHAPASGPGAQAPYNAPTQQFTAYAPAAGQHDSYRAASQPRPVAQPRPVTRPAGYAPAGYAAAADRTGPQSYLPAPPAAAQAPGGYQDRGGQAAPPAGTGGYQPGQLPAAGNALPAPAPGRTAAGNPYGSYISPPARSGPQGPPAGLPGNGIPAAYDRYARGPASDPRESPYPPPAARGGNAGHAAGPSSGWYPGAAADPLTAAYPDVPPRPAAPGGQEAGYQNGDSRSERAGYPAGPEPAGYRPAGYAARPQDDGRYAGPDPYARDPYGAYPGHGTDR